MRFIEFDPLDIGAAPIELLRELLEPETPAVWVEFAEQAFVVLCAAPELRELTRRDLARCAIAVVYQIVSDMSGDLFYVPAGVRLNGNEIL